MYAAGEYDLAGTIVGVVEQDRLLDGSRIEPGDAIVALASSGLHTNGYSLARQVVFERMRMGPDDVFPGEEGTVADVLLRTHRSYLPALMPLLERGEIRGLAHITGGGLLDNIPRVLPPGLDAHLDTSSWELPSVFRTLQAHGGIEKMEMFRVFNMGIGMVALVDARRAYALVRELNAAGEQAWVTGEIRRGSGRVLLSWP
jgi:phosphoribosylformylglycinamidine cyclo-ligase